MVTKTQDAIERMMSFKEFLVSLKLEHAGYLKMDRMQWVTKNFLL